MTSIRRASKAASITLTPDNVVEVRALLETSPALTTAPRTIGDGGIDVTINTLGDQATYAVVLEGDQIVTAEVSFEIRCDAGSPRSRLPRYLMPEHTAAAIRQQVWTPGIREEHRTNTGRSTHHCSCQFGKSWQCGEGDLHHKCIYGRDSRMWNSAAPECVITWPDAHDATFPEPVRSYEYSAGKTWFDHRAVVWLADRACRSGCGCDCHADVLARPPAPMTDEAAAWVRAFVWTKKMRKTHSEVPAAAATCACQAGPSGHCSAGRHGKCWHTDNEPYASSETYVCGPDGTTVLAFTERYMHPTAGATGAKRDASARVWLADRACRWRCPCGCHTSSGTVPQPPLAALEPRIDKPVQLDLFDALTA